jgi:transcriptional regulator with XRE-family HTH domain
MNTHEWFKDKLESLKGDFEFRLETLVLEITEKISKKMKQKKISRKDLAALLEVSPPAVTKILDGNSNFTLRKLLSLADALDLALAIDFKEKAMVERAGLSYGVYIYGQEASEEEKGYTLITVTGGSTQNIAANDATASITLPSPFPSSEKGNLEEAVNA